MPRLDEMPMEMPEGDTQPDANQKKLEDFSHAGMQVQQREDFAGVNAQQEFLEKLREGKSGLRGKIDTESLKRNVPDAFSKDFLKSSEVKKAALDGLRKKFSDPNGFINKNDVAEYEEMGITPQDLANEELTELSQGYLAHAMGEVYGNISQLRESRVLEFIPTGPEFWVKKQPIAAITKMFRNLLSASKIDDVIKNLEYLKQFGADKVHL